MVLAERNTELVRNGRRSRGPSPNSGVTSGAGAGAAGNLPSNVGGAGTPETSSDDDNSIKRNGKNKAKQSEYEEKIRVGRDYQAVCPPLVPEHERKPEILNERALLVWSPTKDIPDSKLEEYISVAKEKYGYNGEQALGMLFWHKHDLERAVMDLSNFTPFPDEWTVEDKVLFEQAFQFHGKSFHRIRQMLPDKSIASLVKYYYSWKKSRGRQSVMDRQEKLKAKEGSENGSENGSNEDSDEDKDGQASTSGYQDSNDLGSSDNLIANVEVDPALNEERRKKLNDAGRSSPVNVNGHCVNCGVACNILNDSPQGSLCLSCHHHWRRTGNMRPTSGPCLGRMSREREERRKRKPPKGIYVNHDDIVTLASGNEDLLLAKAERELIALKTRIQFNKQLTSTLKKMKSSEDVEVIRALENPSRVNSRWTNEELSLAVQGVRKYGKDFQTIAELIGTKSETHVRQFYANYRRRYNLDQVLKEFEAEKDALVVPSEEVKAEIEAINIEIKEILNKIEDEQTIILSPPPFSTTPSLQEEIETLAATSLEVLAEQTSLSVPLMKTEENLDAPNNLETITNDIIMEIDLDEPSETASLGPPPAKKIALDAERTTATTTTTATTSTSSPSPSASPTTTTSTAAATTAAAAAAARPQPNV